MKIRRIRLLLYLAGALALVVALGLFAWRPAPVLGVDGGALASSVLGGALTSPCERLPQGLWRCDLYLGLYDEQPNAVYQVEVNRLGCWAALNRRATENGYPKHESGCLTIADYVNG
ncbi:MAG TPA: hypothetical protein VHI77_08585 [Solirubrobacterales bacterium]|nr:hypothetical protein [Solirubrobacterales bacterium]